jgi:hypothetical protein
MAIMGKRGHGSRTGYLNRWIVRGGLAFVGVLSIFACVVASSIVVRPGVIELAPTALLLAVLGLGVLPVLTFGAVRLDARVRHRERIGAEPSSAGLVETLLVVCEGERAPARRGSVGGARRLRHGAHAHCVHPMDAAVDRGFDRGGAERLLSQLLERDRHHDVHEV